MFVHQILVISEHFNLLSKEHVPMFLESLCCAQQFSFCSHVPRLRWVQLAATESC